MNDKTREQIEAMKMQTIGVEVEMNNITREKAARKVAEFFRTTAWYAAGEYGYMSWACKDQQGRVWKFQWCCTIKVDIGNSKSQYIAKDKQEARKDGSESTKIQHGI